MRRCYLAMTFSRFLDVSTMTLLPWEGDVPTPSMAKTPSISVATTSTAPYLVRPYVQRVRARPADPIPELIREIIQSHEKFRSRMTKCDKVIQISQERFMFGLGIHRSLFRVSLHGWSIFTLQRCTEGHFCASKKSKHANVTLCLICFSAYFNCLSSIVFLFEFQ